LRIGGVESRLDGLRSCVLCKRPGYNYANEFDYGVELILDSLERDIQEW
jgi:hypothetical protein